MAVVLMRVTVVRVVSVYVSVSKVVKSSTTAPKRKRYVRELNNSQKGTTFKTYSE